MAEPLSLSFPAWHRIRSLIWSGDRLVDPVGGYASVGLDGSATRAPVGWAYKWDRALATDDGQATVLYMATAADTVAILITATSAMR